MANRSSGGVALRLGMEADGSVKTTFDEIEQKGSATAKRLVGEYTRAGEDIEKALARRDRAGAQIAAMAGGYKLGSNQDAQVQAYARAMGEADRQAAALRAVLDPLSAAQARYSQEVETANRLLRLNKIGEQEHAQALAISTAALDQARRNQLGPEQAAHVEAYARAMGEADRQAAALRAVLDPLSSAQGRYDQEVETANRLLRLNKIGEQEHAQALAISTAALDEAKRAQNAGAVSDNARKFAMQNLGFQFQDFAVQVVGGTSVLRAFALQAPQAAGALTSFGGILGSVGGFLATGWGTAVLLGTTLLAGFADKLFDGGDAAKAAADGLEQFRQRQADIGNFIDQTTGKLKEQNATLLRNAVLTRQAAIDKNAAQAREMGESAFSQANGLTTGSWSQRAGTSVMNWLTGQSRGRYDAGPARDFDPAISAVISRAGGDVEKLDAGLQALARRRPDLKATVATVSDAAAQAVRLSQENKRLGGEIDQLTGKTTAQTRVTTSLIEKQVALATATTPLGRAQAQLALVKERATAADKAGGEALKTYRADLTAAESAVNAAEAAERAARGTRKELAKDTRDAARAHEELVRAVEALVRQGDPGGAALDDFRAAMERIQKQLAAGEIDQDAADAAGRAAAQNMAEGFERQWTARSALTRETISKSLTDGGAWVSDEQMKAAADRAMKVIGAAATSVSPALQKIRDTGADLVDRVLKPSSWREWAGSGKAAIKEIGDELFKLALINPLKNLISGTSKGSTLTSLVGSLAGLFGGAKIDTAALSAGTAAALSNVRLSYTPAPLTFASGTNYAPGGPSIVGEFGKELVDLPRGARVTPAAETRRLLDGPTGGSRSRVDIGLNDDLLYARVTSIVDDRIGMAAPGIAHGGAQLAEARAAKRLRYRIPGR